MVGPEILPARRYLEQGRPHEHGAFIGSAAAISGSSHRGICGYAASCAQDTRLAPEDRSQTIDEGQASRDDPAAEESWFRHSGARVDAGAAARASAGYNAVRARGAQITFPAGRGSGVGAATPGTPHKYWLSLVGSAASVPMDEKMANSGGAFSGASFLDTGKNRYIYLAVLLFAGAIYLGCIISPPSLMDDS